MKTDLYNILGSKKGQVELSDDIFSVKIKPEVVHEVYTAQLGNQREPWADTKNRGEVSGGGKKPWKQKGTGRARHGSIRSPIWRGGGVAFGPLSERSYKTKINVKKRRLATKMCLTDKAANSLIYVVDNYSFSEPKTKLGNDFIKALSLNNKSVLFLTKTKDDTVMRVTSNLPKVSVLPAADVNVLKLLSSHAIVVSEEAVRELESILNK